MEESAKGLGAFDTTPPNPEQLAFNSALMQGFFDSRREKDRSLLALSGGGIGLLVTLLSTIGVSCLAEIALYAFGLIIFTIVIILILRVFDKDADLMVVLRKGNNAEVKKLEDSLKGYDKTVMVLFIIGIAISMTIGILSAVNQLNKKGSATMAFINKGNEKKPNLIGGDLEKQSMGGISNFQADSTSADRNLQGISTFQGDGIKSQTGLSNFKPPVAIPSQQTTTETTDTNKKNTKK